MSIRIVRIAVLAAWPLACAAAGAAAQDAPGPKDEREQESYAVGMNLGDAIRRRAANLDLEQIVQGLRDAVLGNGTHLTESEMRAILQRLQSRLAAGPAPPDPPAVSIDRSVASAIDISFKLDQRLTRGVWMGDRWVSPPYTQVGDGPQVAVEARAAGIDADRRVVPVTPDWAPEDEAMVEIIPRVGTSVVIHVRQPGETRIAVSADGVRARIGVKAARRGSALEVDLVVLPAPAPPPR